MQLYCPYCMHAIVEDDLCPACGKKASEYISPGHHLPSGTRLKEQYVIGRALGEGGFGITYLAWDTNLERRVAIKEFFPKDRVRRESTCNISVSCYTSVAQADYESSRDRFIKEARTIAKLDDNSEIVRVLDFFPENGTAYIVMEFLEGETLKELTERKPFRADELLPMLEPIFSALQKVHDVGIIHRDISPDNLMRLTNGQIKLMDFGCARDIAGGRPMTAVLKPGFAPVEQFLGGQQGPWTDVYSLSATIFYCLTGMKPQNPLDCNVDEKRSTIPLSQYRSTLPLSLYEAKERLSQYKGTMPLKDYDELIEQTNIQMKALETQNAPLSDLSESGLTAGQFEALRKGMAIMAQDRWQSVKEFHDALYLSTSIPYPPDKPGKSNMIEKALSFALKALEECGSFLAEHKAALAAIVAIIVIIIVIAKALPRDPSQPPPDDSPKPSGTVIDKFDDGMSPSDVLQPSDVSQTLQNLEYSGWVAHLPSNVDASNSLIDVKLQYRSAPVLKLINDATPPSENYKKLDGFEVLEDYPDDGNPNWVDENDWTQIQAVESQSGWREVFMTTKSWEVPSDRSTYMVKEKQVSYDNNMTTITEYHVYKRTSTTSTISRTRQVTYSYYDNSAWSDYTDEAIKQSDNLLVNYRMQYRYAPLPNGMDVQASMMNFPKFEEDYTARFRDVDDDAWYGANKRDILRTVNELKILLPDPYMNFHPDQKVTVGQMIRAAVMINRIYNGYTGLLGENNGDYQIYADYAVEHNMIRKGEFSDLSKDITRQEMAYILYAALPSKEFATKMSISAISDMDMGYRYYDCALAMAEAGVINLNKDRQYRPEDTATRAEAASIIDAMVYPEHRQSGN